MPPDLGARQVGQLRAVDISQREGCTVSSDVVRPSTGGLGVSAPWLLGPRRATAALPFRRQRHPVGMVQYYRPLRVIRFLARMPPRPTRWCAGRPRARILSRRGVGRRASGPEQRDADVVGGRCAVRPAVPVSPNDAVLTLRAAVATAPTGACPALPRIGCLSRQTCCLHSRSGCEVGCGVNAALLDRCLGIRDRPALSASRLPDTAFGPCSSCASRRGLNGTISRSMGG